jgi:tetratricopeptide (TPR) repeat protein
MARTALALCIVWLAALSQGHAAGGLTKGVCDGGRCNEYMTPIGEFTGIVTDTKLDSTERRAAIERIAAQAGTPERQAALKGILMGIAKNYFDQNPSQNVARNPAKIEPPAQARPPEPTAGRERPVLRQEPGRPEARPDDLRAIGDRMQREWMDRREAQDPKNPAVLADRGMMLYHDRSWREAGRYLSQAIKGGVKDSRVFSAYGGVAYEAKDYQLAADMARQALALDASNAQAQALLKLAHDRPSISRLNESLAVADKSGSISPDSPFAKTLEAAQMPAGPAAAGTSVLDDARRAELAAAAARQAVTPPGKIEQSAALAREAERALRIGDYAGAQASASGAIELNGSNAQAWNYRAMAHSNQKKYAEAVYDATYAVTLEPKQAAPWVTRSWAFGKQGLYKEAERDARMALEKAPGNAYAYHDLAFALAGQGHRELAVEALRLASTQDPRFREKYQTALQLAPDADMTLLFADAPVAPAPVPAAARRNRFLRVIVLSLSGGVLVALGLLQVFAAGWREKVHATIRRALAAAPASSGRAAAEGFWGQYEMLREIGSGGMGVVFEARDRALDRRVAVKRMRDEIRRDPQERARFVQEARTVAKLHHPNIVEIYAIVEHEDDVYLVFEYIDGMTLGERLRLGSLPFSQARGVMAGVCAAVDFAHRHGVIHRDLKPSNIMIAADGTVKVMDFGVARQAKDALTKMSMTNTIAGTPPYMAPEQEQGSVRRESDLFALGVVLYEAVSGRLPFAGVGAGMLLNKINGRCEPLRPGPGVPAGLQAVVTRALTPDPDGRYRNAAELLAALDALAAATPA